MITAALRMFMELGMVQKFKIDYEVRGEGGGGLWRAVSTWVGEGVMLAIAGVMESIALYSIRG